MTARVHKRVRAKRDLIEDFIYLAEHAGVETADRFLANAEESFFDLATHPGMGTELTVSDSRLAGLRKWRVNDFERFLIFYLPRPDGVSIVRVLHAAQDWWKLLGAL